MPRILVVGGYGVFGARVVERLVRSQGIEVIVAGRDPSRAKAFVAGLDEAARPRVEIATLDATTCTREAIVALSASVLVNASGPFQEQDYRLARAAIAAGVHYVDLADSRGFVTGISALDGEARAAGVLVVSGASTVPGISAAVIAAYAAHFDRLTEVRIGISPGNSFDPGLATTRSILSGVGQPMRVRRDGNWHDVHGWQGLERVQIQGAGRRWMGWCDVPDLDLLPARHARLETAQFKAGVEVGAFHLALWMMSWPVRWGLPVRLASLAWPLLAVKRWLGFLGSDVGAMLVEMAGDDREGGRREIGWHLVARRGHGPYIPAIASVLIARGLIDGTIRARGAMPCLDLVSLDAFLDEVSDLEIRATDTATPLYQRVLGKAFGALPGQVQALHMASGKTRWRGRADVTRGRGPLSGLVAWCLGLPPAGHDVALDVTFVAEAGHETWTRNFGGRSFQSTQSLAPALQEGDDFLIAERLGPVRLLLRPVVRREGLSLQLAGLSALGVPLPRWLGPQIATRKWEDGGRYRFDVAARLPLIGLIVRYTGWLVPEAQAAAIEDARTQTLPQA